MSIRRMFMLLVVAVSVLMINGCAFLSHEQVVVEPIHQPQPQVPQPPESPEDVEEQSILKYLSAVQQWSPEQLNVVIPVLESAYARESLTINRLRLAMALGFGDCDSCNSGRALGLFNEELELGSTDTLKALASLCADLLESRKLADKANRNLAGERRKVKELQQKLDALTSIEKSLHQRE